MPEAATAPAPAAPPVPVVNATPTAPAPVPEKPGMFDRIDKAAEKSWTDDGKPPGREPHKGPPRENPDKDKPLKFTPKGDGSAPKKPEAPKAPEEVVSLAKAQEVDGKSKVITDPKTTEITDDTPAEKMAPAALRSAYDKLKKELKEIRGKTASDPKEHPEFKSLSEKVAAKEKEYAELQKRANDLEETIRYVDYEKSSEFQEKYYKPYVATWRTAAQEIAKLSVPNEDGTTRKATIEDLQSIVSEPDTERALDMAEKLFGNATKANYVINHRDRIIAASQAQEEAKAEYKEKGAALSKQSEAHRAEATKQETELWESNNKAWQEKHKDFLAVEDGDEKGKEALDLGVKAADMAFGDTSSMTLQQRAKLYSDTRNRAAMYGVVSHKLTKAQEHIKALEAQIAEYEQSGPGKGATKGDEEQKELSVLDRLDRMATGV